MQRAAIDQLCWGESILDNFGTAKMEVEADEDGDFGKETAACSAIEIHWVRASVGVQRRM